MELDLDLYDDKLEPVRVAVYGKYGVGKTTLIHRLNNKTYEQTIGTASTRGVEYVTLPGYFNVKTYLTDGTVRYKTVKIRCTDTMGQERFRAIVRTYFAETQIALIICAANDLDSIENDLPYYSKELLQFSELDIKNGRRGKKLLAILNKIDVLEEGGPEKLNNLINVATFRKIASSLNIDNMEISAKLVDSKHLREYLENAVVQYYAQKESTVTALIDFPMELYVSNLTPRPTDPVVAKNKCCH